MHNNLKTKYMKTAFTIRSRPICRKATLLLPLLALLLPSVQAHGQNIFYDLSAYSSEKPSIKNYKPDVDIKYERYYSGAPSTFDYIDRANNVTYSFSLPDAFLRPVSDYEIHKGKVYFCGSSHIAVNRSTAFFGWFDIDSVYFHNGDVHIFELPVSVDFVDLNQYDANISVFRKLSVVEGNGVVHLAMTGDGSHNHQLYGVIANAYGAPGSGAWTVGLSMDFSGTVTFEDIAITYGYVVALARNNSNEHCILEYPHPSLVPPGESFLGVPSALPISTPMYITPQSIFTATPYAMFMTGLDHGNTDAFVTVCSDGYDERLVSFYQNPGYCNRRLKYDTPRPSRIEEISYSDRHKTLCMVSGDEVSVIYRMTDPYSEVYRVHTGPDYRWRSIDVISSKGNFIISGPIRRYGAGGLWHYNVFNLNECVDEEPHPTHTLDKSVIRGTLPRYVVGVIVYTRPFSVRIHNHRIRTYCK